MKLKRNSKIKVYVAMSGGVDSSVAAALLKKQGYEVTGVFFKPWSPSADSGQVPIEYCDWREDRQDALRVATKLGIKFKTWDFSREYGKQVTKYMIDSYRAGITPNPDVKCNKDIKFGLFLNKALKEGADFIATGHYARIKKQGSYKLLKGVDANKDQSYFLYNLIQKELKHSLFPIGEYTKPEVRKLAKKFGLPNHGKKDSQGVCFVGQLDMKEFLTKYIKPKNGEVKLLETGETIGTHDGVYYYTIGQRHGLNLGIAGGPHFVIKKDIAKNVIYVSNNLSKKSLNSNEFIVKDVTWVNPINLPSKADIKIRYRGVTLFGAIALRSVTNLTVKFSKPAQAVTPGQSVVFYRGQEVLGGGVIT